MSESKHWLTAEDRKNYNDESIEKLCTIPRFDQFGKFSSPDKLALHKTAETLLPKFLKFDKEQSPPMQIDRFNMN